MKTRYFILVGLTALILGTLLYDLTSLKALSISLMVLGSASTIILGVLTYLDENINF